MQAASTSSRGFPKKKRLGFSKKYNPVLGLFGLLAGFPGILALFSMAAASGDISGKVFRDFNANGIYEDTPTYKEPGVPGVKVKAYAASGSEAASATTAADGSYTLAGLANSTEYRVEFTSLQEGDFSGAYGSGSGTSVQFIRTGLSGATDADLGINYPGHYSNSQNPHVATSGFYSGNPLLTPANYEYHAIWAFPFNASGNLVGTGNANLPLSADIGQKKDLGMAKDLGAVWGMAYSKRTRKIYSAAFTKRHAGFGPQGPGAIYEVPLNGDYSPGSTPALFYAFPASQVGPVDGDGYSAIHGELPGQSGLPSYDTPAFDNVGKTSLGGLDISADEKDLFVINLYDKALKKIDIATKQVTSYAIPDPVINPTPEGGLTWRPFAVKCYRGKTYVGLVVTNELSYNTKDTYSAGAEAETGDREGMTAIVYAFDGASFSQVLSFPLNYTKASTWYYAGKEWLPWTNLFRRVPNGTNPGQPGQGSFRIYPQPWLTDIEFDVNGDMILGIRDRMGDQMGVSNYFPGAPVGPGGTGGPSAVAIGEVLRAGRTGPSSWAIEQGGSVNGSTANSFQATSPGPGNGKYYWGERLRPSDQYNGDLGHGSSSQGGVVQLAGSGKVMTTALSPTDLIYSGGVRRLFSSAGFTNARGTPNSLAGQADDNLDLPGPPSRFDNGPQRPSPGEDDGLYKGAYLYKTGLNGFTHSWNKANGLGDIELLTAPAPVEIGNRVWKDTNHNGIQDPGEEPLAGVIVVLRRVTAGAGQFWVQAVTDSEGRYIFSSDPDRTSTESFRYNIDLRPEWQYSITIFDVSGSNKQPALGNLTPTLPDNDPSENGDARDSDGIAGTTPEGAGYVRTVVTIGQTGENNHTYDFGFYDQGALPVTLSRFEATAEGSSARLTWSTAAELNVSRFEIERSPDAKDWKKIGEVASRQKSGDYTFTDPLPVVGYTSSIRYYRLKMVDLDGTFAYSHIESITFKTDGHRLNVSPNPATDRVNISVENGLTVKRAELYSPQGRLMRTSEKGQIDISGLPPAVYLLKILTSDGKKETRKVVVAP